MKLLKYAGEDKLKFEDKGSLTFFLNLIGVVSLFKDGRFEVGFVCVRWFWNCLKHRAFVFVG